MKSFVLLGASLNPEDKALYSMTKAQIMLIFNKYGLKSQIKIISIGGQSRVHRLFYRDELVLLKEYGVSKKSVVQGYIKSKLFSKRHVIIEKILEADYVWDISSGQEFSDNLGVKEFIVQALVKLIIIKQKKPYILLPQVIGPFKSFWRKGIARKILNNASYVYVRDTISKDTLLFDLKIRSEVRQSIDISFYADEKLEYVSKSIDDRLDKNLKIGINISSRVNNVNIIYSAIMQEIIEKLNEKVKIDIILFPYEVEDYNLSKDIELKIKKKYSLNIKTVSGAYSGQELKEQIRECDVFIGSSFYTCIDAVTACIPTVFVAANTDISDGWRRVGMDNYLCDLTKVSKKEIIEKVEQICTSIEEVNRELKIIIPKLRKEIEGIVL